MGSPSSTYSYEELGIVDDAPVMARLEFLKAGLPAETQIVTPANIEPYVSRKVRVFAPGQFDISLIIHKENQGLYWESIRVDDTSSARGVWSGFARNVAAVAIASGRNRITGEAGYEDGGYAMARGRFVLQEGEWQALQSHLMQRLDGLAPLIQRYVADGYSAVMQAAALIASDDPKALWAIADMGTDCRAIFNAVSRQKFSVPFYTSFRNGELDLADPPEKPLLLQQMFKKSPKSSLGWLLLTRSNYSAVMPVADPAYRDVLYARYAGLKTMVQHLI